MQKPREGTHPVDKHVGMQLKARRNLIGMSQDDLAQEVDLTYQQIQKYERGANRIGASRLFELSKILNVAISYFFEGIEGRASRAQPGFSDNPQAAFAGPGQAMDSANDEEDVMQKRETYDLIRAYYNINDPKLRQQILSMAKAMAKSNV